MKKTNLAILVLFLFGFVNAQKVKFGLKAGLNISSVTVKDENISGTISSKAGFHAGIFLSCPLSEKFEIRPEILYSNQGYKYSGTDLNADFKQKSNIDYITVPLMFYYYPAKKFDVEIGPQISFLLSNKAKLDYNIDSFDPSDPDISGSSTIDNKDSTQSLEVGLNVGIGYKLTQNLSINTRYNFGLSNINKKEQGQNASDEKVRNSVFQFSLAYLFD